MNYFCRTNNIYDYILWYQCIRWQLFWTYQYWAVYLVKLQAPEVELTNHSLEVKPIHSSHQHGWFPGYIPEIPRNQELLWENDLVFIWYLVNKFAIVFVILGLSCISCKAYFSHFYWLQLMNWHKNPLSTFSSQLTWPSSLDHTGHQYYLPASFKIPVCVLEI